MRSLVCLVCWSVAPAPFHHSSCASFLKIIRSTSAVLFHGPQRSLQHQHQPRANISPPIIIVGPINSLVPQLPIVSGRPSHDNISHHVTSPRPPSLPASLPRCLPLRSKTHLPNSDLPLPYPSRPYATLSAEPQLLLLLWLYTERTRPDRL